MILAAASLIVSTGALATAQADGDHNSTTLYTSAVIGGTLACNVVNVAHKTLTITISIIDGSGHPLFVSDPTPTPPRVEFSQDYGKLTDTNEGYCVFQVSGTGNRDDVRAILASARVAKQTTADGITFPFFATRVLEAH